MLQRPCPIGFQNNVERLPQFSEILVFKKGKLFFFSGKGHLWQHNLEGEGLPTKLLVFVKNIVLHL